MHGALARRADDQGPRDRGRPGAALVIAVIVVLIQLFTGRTPDTARMLTHLTLLLQGVPDEPSPVPSTRRR